MSIDEFAKQHDLIPNPDGIGLMVPDRSKPRSAQGVSKTGPKPKNKRRGGNSTPEHMKDGGGPEPTIDPSRRSVEWIIPVRTVSEANQRNHWEGVKRRKKQRRVAFNISIEWVDRLPPKPWRITLTRFGAQRMDRGNLGGSMKGPEDGLADALKIDDDGRDGTKWEYDQRPDGRRTAIRAVGVKIETIT